MDVTHRMARRVRLDAETAKNTVAMSDAKVNDNIFIMMPRNWMCRSCTHGKMSISSIWI